MRADAERNRQRILAAAREAFAERGVEVGVDEIARRAGVGIATLYRRFPTKAALATALLEERLRILADIARRAEAIADPWEAFVTLVHDVVAAQARDRSFDQTLPEGANGEDRQVAALRSEVVACGERVVQRASEAGRLRPDFTFADLMLMTHGLARISAVTREIAPRYWERPLTVMLDGLAVGDPARLPGSPPDRAQVQAALRRRR